MNNKQPLTKDFLQEKISAIENIMKDIEENTLPLDYLMNRYEEGMKIAKDAKQYLSKLEGRLIDITAQNNEK